jgi:hypothetical protein
VVIRTQEREERRWSPFRANKEDEMENSPFHGHNISRRRREIGCGKDIPFQGPCEREVRSAKLVFFVFSLSLCLSDHDRGVSLLEEVAHLSCLREQFSFFLSGDG